MKLINLTLLAILFTSSCATKKAPYDYVKAGNALAQDGLFKEAAESYKTAIKKNRKNLVAKRNLGIVYLKAGNLKGAISNLEAVQRVFKDNFEAQFYLGEAYRAKSRHADAIYIYKKALEISPDEKRALRALAWSYYEVRNFQQGLRYAKRLVRKDPRDVQSNIVLARILIKLQKPNSALKTLGEIMVSKKSRMQPYIDSVKGDAFYQKGMIKTAKKYYKRSIKEQPLLAGALLGYGKCLLENGSVKPSIAYLERAVRIRPKLTEGYLLLGRLHEAVDPKKSIYYYNKFRKYAVKDPEFLSQVNGVKRKISKLKFRK